MANYLDEEGLRRYNELIQEKIKNSGGSSGGSSGSTTNLKAGENINITDDGYISVVTTNEVEEDNTKPITSAAVYTEVGNINVLLKTI